MLWNLQQVKTVICKLAKIKIKEKKQTYVWYVLKITN